MHSMSGQRWPCFWPLLARIEQGDIDLAFMITHYLRLEEVPYGYKSFRDKKDNCIKIVLRP
jgi:threonine dehydrogenase-like Zn-dependent dehydrogenase